jgi:Ca-activated chloride channel family protein
MTMVQAQSDRQLIREGNRLYRSGKYAQAETAYRKAVSKNQQNARAVYNLGCALMKQNNDSAAIDQFTKAAEMDADKANRALAYHNMGVMYQQKKNYQEAIRAYQDALRNNPKDADSRYNLALCKRQQQKQQQQKQQQQQDNKDQQKDKNKDKNQQKDKDKKQNQQQDQNNQQQKPKEQMSKENAEQLLNAAMQQEKETQQRLKKAMQQPQRRKLEKNW